jgi:hypothetical protein
MGACSEGQVFWFVLPVQAEFFGRGEDGAVSVGGTDAKHDVLALTYWTAADGGVDPSRPEEK